MYGLKNGRPVSRKTASEKHNASIVKLVAVQNAEGVANGRRRNEEAAIVQTWIDSGGPLPAGFTTFIYEGRHLDISEPDDRLIFTLNSVQENALAVISAVRAIPAA